MADNTVDDRREMTGKYWGGERGVRSAKDLEAVALYVTLSVKTKLKSFFL